MARDSGDKPLGLSGLRAVSEFAGFNRNRRDSTADVETLLETARARRGRGGTGRTPREARTKLKLPKKSIDEIEALVRESVVVKTPAKHLGLRIGDPDDQWGVACAMAGRADELVTGDAPS